jgi:hypothetical protein
VAESKFTYQNDGAVKRVGIWDDDYPDKYVTYTEQDLTQAVENNKILRELHPRRSTNKLIARGVPLAVAERAMREQWDESDWAKWLDDPDNAAFRVWQGRVGK